MARATVKGENRLRRKLLALEPRMLAAVRAAMEEQADEIVEEIKRLCPVEEGKPDLRDTIRWFWAPDPTRPETLRLRFTVGNSELFYAPFLEFGTVHMKARPFFLPTWRVHKARLVAAMRAALVAAVEAVAAGG